MSKHTPGPWIVEDNPTIEEGKQVAAFSDDGNRVLQVLVRTHNPEDLALIAAAPELLEALRRANDFITNGIALGFIRMPDIDTPDPAHETPALVRAAIAKARGEE